MYKVYDRWPQIVKESSLSIPIVLNPEIANLTKRGKPTYPKPCISIAQSLDLILFGISWIMVVFLLKNLPSLFNHIFHP